MTSYQKELQKCGSGYLVTTQETVEFTGEAPEPGDRSRMSRQRRYDLLSSIRRIDPTHRTASCLWCRVSASSQLNVVKDFETGKARFSGLRVCSRVWTCPVCAAKISERRAVELAQSIGAARAMHLHVALLTVTVPHVRTDSLESLIDSLGQAWYRFTNGGTSSRLRRAIKLTGTIRNIEVTSGENGWHPHFHCLIFFQAEGVDLPTVEQEWGKHWQNCAVRAGLRRPSDEHGLTIQNGDHAAQYVSKWGLEHEMTKSMAKQSRRGGRTPFDIADDFGDGIETERSAALWREFAKAFHGKRQLYWSTGLKKLLSIEDKEDKDLIEEEENRPAELVVQLTWPEWQSIRAKHRATLLDLAESHPQVIRDFLAERVRAFERASKQPDTPPTSQ